MIIYTVLKGPITVHAAGTQLLRLLPDQVQRRRAQLAAVDAAAGIYRFKPQVPSTQFKTGEAFGFDGDPKRAFVGQPFHQMLSVAADPVSPPVALPSGWRDLKFAELQELAAQFTEAKLGSKAECIEWIVVAIEEGRAIEPLAKAAE